MGNYTHNQARYLVLCGLLLQQCNKHRSSSTSFTYPFYLHWLCYHYYTSFSTSLSNITTHNTSANTSDCSLHYTIYLAEGPGIVISSVSGSRRVVAGEKVYVAITEQVTMGKRMHKVLTLSVCDIMSEEKPGTKFTMQ